MKNKILFFSFLAAGLVIGATALAAVTSNLMPAADGTYSTFTPKSGTSHYAMVDESACNGTADYNYTSTIGRRDSYKVSLASVPDGATISSISLTPCASANKTGSSVMNVFYRYNGVNSADAGNYSLSGTTPVAKAATNFNGLSFVKGSGSALEVGAVYSSGSKGVRLSRLATVVTYTPLAAPTNLTAFASGTTAFLSWTDNSANETGFVIERSLSTSTGFSVIHTTAANQNYYSDSGLAAGKYYYRVKAINAGGSSAYSNTISATIIILPPAPNAPTSLNAFSSSTSVFLFWSDNSLNESGFTIQRGTDGVNFSQIDVVGANVSYYTDASSKPAGTYYYRVRAYNAGGNSNFSNTASAIVY